MDQQTIDLLLGESTGETANPLGSSLDGFFTYMMVASLVLTLAFIALWVAAWLHRRKVENAIIDIRNTLNEMNEREKARQAPPAPLPPRDNDTRHIAVTEIDSSHEPV